ncbi:MULTISPECIES: hypothetical protein [Streptomyces]|jgi:hypothetical protein|uniref:hypothetical protein n=1 Tax=Streptomyces TaxID=1883 RepID=UPI00167B91A4|nr:hypothetical protein [Streptomyces umbrinus]MCR3726731.1 hypothetical protein [Streptomyces umbrinus]GHB48460.1 hypothetical protein GCM10010306_047520 [Streptomyces umbrinus]GHH33909.1 hypothetical protein GCM10018775_05770 [Streptomyces umbrinus]
MKQVLEFLGVIALVQGVAGLVYEFTGWLRGWGLVQRLDFLDGREIYGSVALLVLAFALFAAAESRKP